MHNIQRWDGAAASGHFARWAVQPLPVPSQRGSATMRHRSEGGACVAMPALQCRCCGSGRDVAEVVCVNGDCAGAAAVGHVGLDGDCWLAAGAIRGCMCTDSSVSWFCPLTGHHSLVTTRSMRCAEGPITCVGREQPEAGVFLTGLCRHVSTVGRRSRQSFTTKPRL